MRNIYWFRPGLKIWTCGSRAATKQGLRWCRKPLQTTKTQVLTGLTGTFFAFEKIPTPYDLPAPCASDTCNYPAKRRYQPAERSTPLSRRCGPHPPSAPSPSEKGNGCNCVGLVARPRCIWQAPQVRRQIQRGCAQNIHSKKIARFTAGRPKSWVLII